jgi:hypothetical protein
MSAGEALYKFSIAPFVKNYKQQQKRSAVSLPITEFECSNVGHFATQLWEKFHTAIAGRAIMDAMNDAAVCTIDPVAPHIEDISHYFLFFKSGRYVTFDSNLTTNVLHTFVGGDPVETYIFKYGDEVQNTTMWNRLQREALSNGSTDRAGAPAEASHQEIINQLKRIHSRE